MKSPKTIIDRELGFRFRILNLVRSASWSREYATPILFITFRKINFVTNFRIFHNFLQKMVKN